MTSSPAAESPRLHVAPVGRVLIFWDYDTQWGGDRSRSPGGPKSWGPLEFTATERLLDLHSEFGIPACFAAVGAAALPGERPYHDPAQIRRIHDAGHEVGSHAMRHEWLPGLSRAAVYETLRSSRDALEQCVGAPVHAFVPPYNQPFDEPRRLSISLSERRGGSPERMNVSGMCRALAETGYRFCRVAFRPALQRLAERARGRRLDAPRRPVSIGGILCARLNTPGGFDAPTLDIVRRTIGTSKVVVVWGHPHSLPSENSQGERHFVPFLEELSVAIRTGKLRAILPRDLLAEEETA